MRAELRRRDVDIDESQGSECIDAIVVAGGIHYEEFGCGEGELPDPQRIAQAAAAAGAHPIAALDQLRW